MPTSASMRTERPAIRPRQEPLRGRVGAVLPIVLLPPGAFAVHQLRFMLAFGAAADAELHRTGHSYLHSVVPWLIALIGLAAGWMLRGVARALSGRRTPGRWAVSLSGLWVLCTAALIAIYVAQESLEGLFASGHPAGLAGIFGFGGWWAVFAAACVGLVLAAVCHGAAWAIETIATRSRTRPPRAEPPAPPSYRLASGALLRPAPLADGWSGRGPPR